MTKNTKKEYKNLTVKAIINGRKEKIVFKTKRDLFFFVWQTQDSGAEVSLNFNLPKEEIKQLRIETKTFLSFRYKEMEAWYADKSNMANE